jgi:hypothetical protein
MEPKEQSCVWEEIVTQKISESSNGRCGHVMFDYKGSVYMFAGTQSQGSKFPKMHVWVLEEGKFDFLVVIGEDIWKQVPISGQEPPKRLLPSYSLVGDKLVIFGGRNSVTVYDDTVILDMCKIYSLQ